MIRRAFFPCPFELQPADRPLPGAIRENMSHTIASFQWPASRSGATCPQTPLLCKKAADLLQFSPLRAFDCDFSGRGIPAYLIHKNHVFHR